MFPIHHSPRSQIVIALWVYFRAEIFFSESYFSRKCSSLWASHGELKLSAGGWEAQISFGTFQTSLTSSVPYFSSSFSSANVLYWPLLSTNLEGNLESQVEELRGRLKEETRVNGEELLQRFRDRLRLHLDKVLTHKFKYNFKFVFWTCITWTYYL